MSSYFSLRNTLGPLFLMTVCPPTAMLLWYTMTHLDGSLLQLFQTIYHEGLWTLLKQVWGPVFFGSKTAWVMLAIFSVTQLLFMRFLPGEKYLGPITPQGNIPIYKANGVSAFAATLLCWFLACYTFELFSPTIIYDHFGELLGSLNLFSLIFCLILMLKGMFLPSSSDRLITGNPLFDYYWGIELYPRIAGFDVKMFTNCRFGLMGWALIILSFAAKQQQLYGLSDAMIVAVALQLMYIGKFFLWETGYLSSLDIMHDHAGFYICWGCLVWVPAVYTSSTLFLVNHPIHLGSLWATLIFAAGAFCITANYLADRQRQKVRSTLGNCTVWGREPTLIHAHYQTEKGESKQNILLASGWWGISRHFHYVPEILGALFWTLPALFTHFLPYFYVIFLTILLIDRAVRDDLRCNKKYGPFWNRYCAKVPYKIIPYVY